MLPSMPLAKIKLVQGLSTPPPGEALVGVITTPVVASNADDTNVKRWDWEVLDVPDTSAVPTGLVQSGQNPIYTFVPDLAGSYMLELRTFDSIGRVARHRLAFIVPESNALLIPPWLGNDESLNYGGQLKGWKTILNPWLKYILTLTGGVVDATTVVKGIVRLQGDLAGLGTTADDPRVSGTTGDGTGKMANTAEVFETLTLDQHIRDERFVIDPTTGLADILWSYVIPAGESIILDAELAVKDTALGDTNIYRSTWRVKNQTGLITIAALGTPVVDEDTVGGTFALVDNLGTVELQYTCPVAGWKGAGRATFDGVVA